MRDRAGTKDTGQAKETSCAAATPPVPDMASLVGNRQMLSVLPGVGGTPTSGPAPVAASGREGNTAAQEDGVWLKETEKDRFLARLKQAVCGATDEGLAGTGRTSAGCPYIERVFAYYSTQSAARVEQAIRRYAPESATAAQPEQMLPLIAARARRAAEQWALSGEITGLPQDGLAGPTLQRDTGSGASGEAAGIAAGLGAGQPLNGSAQSRMESAFGRSFAQVRVHPDAPEASRLNARAFTIGNQVGFAPGEYQPGTEEGDALLAHELAHVAQQRGGPIASDAGAERDADRSAVQAVVSLWSSARAAIPVSFAGAAPRISTGLRLSRCKSGPKRYEWKDEKLKKMVDDPATFAEEIYTHVAAQPPARRQESLHDLEQGRRDYVQFLGTLTEDSELRDPLQNSIRKLDNVISLLYRDIVKAQKPGFTGPETEFARGTAPPELMSGTRPLTDEEKKAVQSTMSPMAEVDPVTGEKVEFKEEVGGINFKDRLRPAVENAIKRQHKVLFEDRLAARAAPGGLFEWPHLEKIANSAKVETDKVFGPYGVRPAFTAGLNIVDRWESIGAQVAVMSDEQKLEKARWRVQKILKDDPTVNGIYKQYGYTPGSAGDTAIEQLTTELAAPHRDELLEIHQGWTAAAPPGQVEIQRNITLPESASPEDQKKADVKTRIALYRAFGTMIHEYIHTLTHSRYNHWVNTKIPDEFRQHTMREGMTDAFTKIVLEGVDFEDEALRKIIEGPFFTDSPRLNAALIRSYYPTHRNAEAIIAIVGLQNALAAYFLGEIELVGGSDAP